jgi:glycosyltransferase involved in cell wall biosynthesis
MRVVFVTHNYPRTAGDMAGAFLHPLAVALQERGVPVTVVAPSDRGQGGIDTQGGVEVRRVRYASAGAETLAYTGTMASAMRTPGGMLRMVSLVRALRREAATVVSRGTGPAVVHAHWWVPGGMALPRGVPAVVTCHGSDVRLLARGGVFQRLGRRTLRRAQVVTTVSQPFAAIIRERTGVSVADDAVQPMPVATVARPRSSGGGGLVVVGRLVAQKRVDLAIRACAELNRRGHATTLTIVGDGAEREALETLARSLDVGAHLRLLGAVAPTAVPGILATADCCLMSAYDEGLGLAAAEAMIQGVPVVACTDGGGVLDVVGTAGGGRVVAPNAAAIADAVLSIAADPDAADSAARTGAEWAARLEPGAVAERAIVWYQRALDA